MWDPEPLTTDTEEWGEESEDGARQTNLEEGVEPNGWWCSQDWEAVMEGSQGLAYDDLWSDSNAMVMGAGGLHHHLTPGVLRSRICRGHQWTDCHQWRPWKCM